jgi:NADH:ubiquinone oxidoreductase subunit 4 (subunit M)
VSGAPWAVPATIWLLATLILWAPRWAGRAPTHRDHVPAISALIAVTILTSAGALAFTTVALAAGLHAWRAWPHTRTGAVALALSGAAALAATTGLLFGRPVLVFGASVVAIALRVGLVPFHTGASQLCERLPALQSQQLATTIALVVAHLRFADQVQLAHDLAPLLVRYGALMTLLPALMALVQRDLRGFYRTATVMHGGMLFAAIGAAGRGHATAALMVVVTTAAAMGGMGVMVSALEDRTGAVSLAGPGGRVQAFPRLAAAFALFGGPASPCPAPPASSPTTCCSTPSGRRACRPP